MYILTSAELDVVAQCLVASFTNYNFINYKAGNSNVKADAVSSVPWDREESETLDNCTNKVIMVGCCCKVALFKPYIGYLSTSYKVQLASPALRISC